MRVVILGLSITSSWGNGHATVFRGLAGELHKRGHEILFLERDTPWYSKNRDLSECSYATVCLYQSLEELQHEYLMEIRDADAVIVGSYVPEGDTVGRWVTGQAEGVTAFYDIDTPITLANLASGRCDYLTTELIRQYQLYLSFTGGGTLQRLEQEFGSPCARPLYCAVDPSLHYPRDVPRQCDLGYLGTYSPDRQPGLQKLLLDPAMQHPDRAFAVAGSQYPREIQWPGNVQYFEHIPPAHHSKFYCGQKFTLNLTRADMLQAGFSPSVRLFEAAACGTAIITDEWLGLESFFEPGSEILVARDAADIARFLREIPEDEVRAIGESGRLKIMAHHTAAHRAQELEGYLKECAETCVAGIRS